ncbi:phosphoribosylanthranilate isomerase [Gammaproteobacteria bacterium]|jgi:phosphoribosylanthranilate isomerase|nr:phosphoribosylanthranilate isomerase [Gammaproteobacteria bacterium]
MKIKICGIKNKEILQHACELGVDFAGFIIADESPRKISEEFLLSLVDFNFLNTKPVFVFVNPSVEMVNKIINLIPASILQFHGDETDQFCNQFNHPYWKSIPVKDSSSLNSINNFASAHGFLLETFSSTSYGGTGQVFDWSLLKNLSLEDRFILAGGINQENIKDAISMNPWCIDVNSGVESKLANKDKALMSDILEVFHDG